MQVDVSEPPGASPSHQLSTTRSQEEAALLQQALAWLQALGIDHVGNEPDDNAGLFADCWQLGCLAVVLQAMRRGEAPSPSPAPSAAQRQHRTFRQRIQDYSRWQQACRELGVRTDLIPLLADLEQPQGTAAVASCLWELANRCAAMGLPVPQFGGGNAMSSLRRSMPRLASARRAELFVSEGSSPPKLPAMGPLLTPRAYACKSGSPAGLAGPTTLRDSNGSLREWLHSGGTRRKVGPQRPHQQQQAGDADGLEEGGSGRGLGLGRTIAALERVAAESASLRSSSPGAQRPSPVPGSQDHEQQQWHRPSLPRLDVEAAVAQAAAEAAEEEAEETGGGAHGGTAAAWTADDSRLSPLSSPTSSLGSPYVAGYSSASQLSSSAQSSPEAAPRGRRSRSASASPRRNRLTPSRLHHAGFDNPLWSQSPQSQGPPPGPAATSTAAAGGGREEAAAAGGIMGDGAGASAPWRSPEPPAAYFSPASAATPLSSSRSRAHYDPEAGSPSPGAGRTPLDGRLHSRPAAASPSPGCTPMDGRLRSGGSAVSDTSRLRRSLDDDEESPGGDGGLLQSLLSPPLLKPSHTRLLGALMHTSNTTAAAAAILEEEGEGEEEEESGLEEERRGEQQLRLLRQPEQGVGAAAPASGVAAHRTAPAATAAPPARASAPPACSAALASRHNSNGGSGGAGIARRLALVALGAVAGAAVAMVAGAGQRQQHRRGSGANGRHLISAPLRPPQLVPPLHTGQQQVHYEAADPVGPPLPSMASSGDGTQASGISWDNPHALLTRG